MFYFKKMYGKNYKGISGNNFWSILNKTVCKCNNNKQFGLNITIHKICIYDILNLHKIFI